MARHRGGRIMSLSNYKQHFPLGILTEDQAKQKQKELTKNYTGQLHDSLMTKVKSQIGRMESEEKMRRHDG